MSAAAAPQPDLVLTGAAFCIQVYSIGRLASAAHAFLLRTYQTMAVDISK
jgi:hypothetical protein